jgi:hypothetical protein
MGLRPRLLFVQFDAVTIILQNEVSFHEDTCHLKLLALISTEVTKTFGNQ